MLSIMMLMLAQDVTGPPGDEPVPPRATLTRQRHCAPGTDDIVVCGNMDSQRIVPLPEPETRRVFGPAATRISPNKSVSVHAEDGNNPFSESPRAMISFKLDF